MKEEVRHFINYQCPCVRQKKPHIQGNAPLLPVTSSLQLEIVRIDFLHRKNSSGGFEFIFLITDHFPTCTQANPTRNKSAKTAATYLYNDFVLRFGIPSELCMIEEGNLRMLFSNTLQTCWVFKICEPPFTTQKQMASLNG